MRIEQVDPEDAEALQAWFRVIDDTHTEKWGDDARWTLQELVALINEPAYESFLLAAVADTGKTIGACRLVLPLKENVETADVQHLSVTAGERRKGIGTALVKQAEEMAEGNSRRIMTGESEAHPGESSPQSDPGYMFATHLGYKAGRSDARRSLLIPADKTLVDKLESESAPYAGGYEIRTWHGGCPPELVPGRLRLATTISTDAPTGDLPFGAETWDEARLREREAVAVAMGRIRFAVGAVHRATNELVGFSDIGVPSALPTTAYQWDTMVLKEHRGHRLGMLMKIANLRFLEDESPATKQVLTWNAISNEPMLRVNDALGFKVVGEGVAWMKELA